MHMYNILCTYIYIYIERERYTHTCVYIYIYIHTHIHITSACCRLPEKRRGRPLCALRRGKFHAKGNPLHGEIPFTGKSIVKVNPL